MRRVISGYEKKLADLPVENTVAISKSGEVLVEKSGTVTRVNFTQAEAKRMKDAIVLHNHPGVASFSETDIATAAVRQVAEMRLVDEVYTCTLKPPGGGWNKTLWEKTIYPVMQHAEAVIIGRFIDDLHHGKITEAQFEANLQHALLRTVAGKTGMKYRRMKRR